jgi:hypothetical protein
MWVGAGSGLCLVPAWRVIEQRLSRADAVVRVVARSIQGTGLQLEAYVQYVHATATAVDVRGLQCVSQRADAAVLPSSSVCGIAV